MKMMVHMVHHKVRCKKCGDIIEYKDRSDASYRGRPLLCKCGAVELDITGGFSRILGSSDDCEVMTKHYWEEI